MGVCVSCVQKPKQASSGSQKNENRPSEPLLQPSAAPAHHLLRPTAGAGDDLPPPPYQSTRDLFRGPEMDQGAASAAGALWDRFQVAQQMCASARAAEGAGRSFDACDLYKETAAVLIQMRKDDAVASQREGRRQQDGQEVDAPRRQLSRSIKSLLKECIERAEMLQRLLELQGATRPHRNTGDSSAGLSSPSAPVEPSSSSGIPMFPTIVHSQSLPQPPSHRRPQYESKRGSAVVESLGRAPAPAQARPPIVRNAQGKPMTPLEIDLEEADKILRRATMLDKKQFADADRRKNAESAAKALEAYEKAAPLFMAILKTYVMHDKKKNEVKGKLRRSLDRIEWLRKPKPKFNAYSELPTPKPGYERSTSSPRPVAAQRPRGGGPSLEVLQNDLERIHLQADAPNLGDDDGGLPSAYDEELEARDERREFPDIGGIPSAFPIADGSYSVDPNVSVASHCVNDASAVASAEASRRAAMAQELRRLQEKEAEEATLAALNSAPLPNLRSDGSDDKKNDRKGGGGATGGGGGGGHAGLMLA